MISSTTTRSRWWRLHLLPVLAVTVVVVGFARGFSSMVLLNPARTRRRTVAANSNSNEIENGNLWKSNIAGRSIQYRQRHFILASSSNDNSPNNKNDDQVHDEATTNTTTSTSTSSFLEQELEYLQNQLSLIEALEERNKAQLDSFVDEQDQWESLEEDERQLLLQKDVIVQRMEILAEELVQLWMGAKSMDG